MRRTTIASSCALLAVMLAGCGGSDDDLPQLAAATPATLKGCDSLLDEASFDDTRFTAAETVAAGTLVVAGTPVPAHCRVTGVMHERVSTVDGQSYAIGFEMRLPVDWNGRFFYQANGGIDGTVVTATGAVNGGNGLDNALRKGFAVLSSDAGHVGTQGPFFGLDPQARLDYGYQAAAALTPMAKALIATAYGKGPDRSYFGGCSNGGRHTMVAAARMPDEYDGYLVGDPGFRLPRAAIANIAGAQSYAALATDAADLSSGFTAAERTLVSNAVLARCDALDGAADGLVQDTTACQAAFDLDRDVPTCSAERDGSCLSAAQKRRIGRLFDGARTADGTRIYQSFPWDNGLGTTNWSFWKFTAPLVLDSGAVAAIWQVPPVAPASFNGPSFALTGDVADMLAKVQATNDVYTESALSFMQPPDATDLHRLKRRGAKMMLYHGTADPIFSSDDTTAFYESLNDRNGNDAARFARFYRVPGMNHCAGGPATDQFDMLDPLVAWVERGVAPDRVDAQVRGPDNAAAPNTELPADWSPNRTRPLCPYPLVARYDGSGSVERASNFRCER